MIEEDFIAQSHFAKIISRSEIAHAGPASLALRNKIEPRIRGWFLFYQPKLFQELRHLRTFAFIPSEVEESRDISFQVRIGDPSTSLRSAQDDN